MDWQFWIDVGGTFTDCIGIAPDGQLHTHKTLSSAAVTGQAADGSTAICLRDPARRTDPQGFWDGATLRLLDHRGQPCGEGRVETFDASAGRLNLVAPGLQPVGVSSLPADLRGLRYHLQAAWPAPVLAIRWLLRLSANQVCPPVQIRFGTTRGTNALLTRTGARTVLLTTRGFRDVPLIGNQSRPDLFALDIRRLQPLFEEVLEVDERIDAEGRVLRPLQTAGVPLADSASTSGTRDSTAAESDLLSRLRSLRAEGFESVAICLLHAWRNAEHERQLEALARTAGFVEVSRSSEVAPLIRFVPRCDTTLLDAALNPVLRDYLDTMRHHLPGSRLQVMTSAGGLVDSPRFRGRDCILSGPAGGIVGFSQVALQEGLQRAIGFDMGGTSTDVARFDGAFEYQQETVKAGVRIMTPVLAIETVAAGGGSICEFDGVRLTVGPHSAGAAPGPACYGAGGPLTVTDLNVYLGRVRPQHFPFPLDVDAVGQRLEALRTQLLAAAAAGNGLTLPGLAEGLLRIATDNMVQAIRRVSVARGYDPADYVLVSLGGAGGQHACSVARSLGIRTVLLHPCAGLLSAWGMGHADIRAGRQHSLLQPLTPAALRQVATICAGFAEATQQEVLEQGIPADGLLPPRHTCELRYVGSDSAIPVAVSSLAEMQAEFEARHRQQFGYIRPQRALEIASVQTETIGRGPAARSAMTAARRNDPAMDDRAAHDTSSGGKPPMSSRHGSWAAAPAAQEQATVWFAEQPLRTPVYLRADLLPGQEIHGPAIICEPASTIVIEPGCSAVLLESGTLQLTIAADPADTSVHAQQKPDHDRTAAAGHTSDPNPVLLEVFGNQFASIAEQMGEMLRRTSVSTNVRERLDFSCALFDADGQLVVNAPHVPVHLGAMGETVRAIMADHPQMQPGDVFVTNDPFRGGSHLPDVTVITPVFVEPAAPSARPAFFTASRAHHAEIGGVQPGSMPPFSRTLQEEGVLIRSCRLVSGGVSREDELRSLLTAGPYPSRAVADNLADLAAQVAANACGARLLQQLAAQHSAATVTRYMRAIQQASARKLRLALQRLPDGRRTFSDTLDDGTRIAVSVTIAGDTATIDFTGTSGVHPGNLNANRAITTAAVLYTLRCLLQEPVPLNAGVLEPVTLIIPDGLLNPAAGADAAMSPAVVGGNVETSQRIVDVLFGALQLAAASQGTMNNLTFGDSSFGYYETICGGAGATANAAGADAVHTHMTNTRLTDPEILEQRFPVRVLRFGIRAGSGGAGQQRGGHGCVRVLQFLRPLQLSILSQRRSTAPYGLCGGQPGQPGVNLLQPPGVVEPLNIGGCFSGEVAEDTILQIATPGGGGWGPASA